MFKYEFKHELKYWATRWSTYFYALLFLGMSLLIYAGSLGFFDPVPEEAKTERWLNSPAGINNILLYFHKFLLILLPTIVGASIYKDYKTRAHALIYSFPITKSAYLLGRLTASLCIVLLISLVVVTGFFLVEQLPGLNPNLMGPTDPSAYGQVFLLYLLPNWLTLGMLTFGMVMLTRNIYTAYAVVAIPILIQSITENAFAGNGYLIALLDPLGQNVGGFYQNDWDIREQNQLSLPIGFLLIANRALWLGSAALFFAYAFRRFQWLEDLSFRKNKTKENLFAKSDSMVSKPLAIPKEYSFRLYGLALVKTIQKNTWRIASSPVFWIFTIAGLLAVIFMVFRVTLKEDFVLQPATQFIIGVPLKVYSLIILLVVFVFSGLLVHWEAQSDMDHLLAVTPIPTHVFFMGKVGALLFIQWLMLFLFMVTGLSIQGVLDYYDFNLLLYSSSLFYQTYVPLVTWTFAAFFIHLLVNNLYLGSFLLFMGWAGIEGLGVLGIDTYLLRFNELPGTSYSVFNGMGHTANAFHTVALYWLAFGSSLFWISVLIYRRGVLSGSRDYLHMIRSRINYRISLGWVISVSMMLYFGWHILQGEKMVLFERKYQHKEFEAFRAQFEPFRSLSQPKIVSLHAKLELFPEEQRFKCSGTYLLINQSEYKIDSVLVKTGFDEISNIDEDQGFKVLKENTYMKVQLIRLRSSLMPGDSLSLHFAIQSQANSLFERNSNVLTNGTFLKSDIFPRLGYDFDRVQPDPSDSLVRQRHYQAIDSDKLDVNLTISTSKDQIALGPGKLLKQWTHEGRAYFNYSTEEPIKFSFGMNSAKFIKQTFASGERKIEVYSLHDKMIPSIIEGVEAAISYNEKYFGHYPYTIVRVIEFPLSEGTYATAFANNLIISELRFLSAPNEEKDQVDIAFYVAAHEMTHHWWGNQLMPANAKGATMLTESITEYLMLRLLEETRGEETALTFYHLQKQRYEKGRKSQTNPIPVLALVQPEEQYISYGKGAVCLYDFSEKVGQERFHQLLGQFHRDHPSPKYPTSLDFVDFLKKQLGPENLELIQKTFLEHD